MMTDATKRRIKTIGIIAAVLTVLLLIALMFAILGVGGFFGRKTAKVEVTYLELSNLDLSVPLIENPPAYGSFAAYPEKPCLDTSIESGDVPCVAYEYLNEKMYFAVATAGSSISFDIFAAKGESVGSSLALGEIYSAQIEGGGAAIYYVDKDGVRYALIPFGATSEQAVKMFNDLFTFAN